MLLLLSPLIVAQSNEPKRVLILTQEDLSWPLLRTLDENLRATLRNGSPEGILIFGEHLDRIHFPDAKIQPQRVAGIQQRYANAKLGLVVGVGDVPADLFPGVPLVYLSTSPQRQVPNGLGSYKRSAGLRVETDARKTIDAARRFQPSARQIVVIGGSSPSEKGLVDQVREQMDTDSNSLPATYLTNLAFAEISKKVADLGPDSIVLFVTLARDGVGRTLLSAEAVSKIAAVSGAVGGCVTRFDEMGKQAGEMGLQFLAGQYPKDQIARSDYIFDWRQLQRWKIPQAALPVGSVVRNRRPTVWESSKWYFLGAIFLFLGETILIVTLLWQRARKRTFQKSLINQMAFERMLSDLSATFIHLPKELVDLTIKQNFGRIAELLKVNRIDRFEYVSVNEEWKATYCWHNEEIQPVEAVIQLDMLRRCTNLLLRGETVILPRLDSLPEEAIDKERQIQSLDASSVALVPLKAGDQLFGAISFGSAQRRIFWTEAQVEQLKLLAEIFSNALMRKWAQEMRFKHVAIVESSDDAIISKTLDGTILSWNPGAQHLFEYTEAEAVGQSIKILIPEELRDEEDNILHRLEAGERIEHFETIRLTKSGKRINVSLTVSPMQNSIGVIVGSSKVARDITRQKWAEQVLRESEDRFRLMANTAPVMIWMSDTENQCTFCNQGWLKFKGRALAEELGSGWLLGLHQDDLEDSQRIFSAAFEARVGFEREYRLRRADGEYRWVLDFGVPRFESDGTFCGYIGSCVDITERKTSEEALHNLTGRLIAAQEEERARIARELHDDFSQRLALLGIGLSQLWKKLPAEEVRERDSVLEMLKATKEISTDLHSLSHQLHSSKLEHVGLGPALAGFCKEIALRYKLEVHFSESEKPLNIPKDVALCLFRVAQEALANVVKHSHSRSARVELVGNGSVVTLRVLDSGGGFDPFVQKPDAGIGLIGMSERLRLVRGQLLIKSQPNSGTEVVAEVPLATAEDGAQVKTQVMGR